MVASGSDFVDTYVGVGARRIRELFEGARMDARNGWLNRNRRSRSRIGKNNASTSSKVSSWLTSNMISIMPSSTLLLNILSDNNSMNHSKEVEDEEAYQRPPTAVVFIDEIDAVGSSRRGSRGGGNHNLFGSGGGTDERERTLDALLTEMDGFGDKDDSSSSLLHLKRIIVM